MVARKRTVSRRLTLVIVLPITHFPLLHLVIRRYWLSLISSLDPKKIYIPGRIEEYEIHGTTVVMDGSHNEQKMRAFVDGYKQLYPDHKPTVLLALKEGKEYIDVFRILREISDSFILTEFTTTQDMPIQSIDAEELHHYCMEIGITSSVIKDHTEALQALLERTGPKIITGSFYLIGQIRSEL